ncbi:hypothetical protein H2200_007177 [Cladophialophora chaetospira]|uniref:Enoyl reductase (ER) domain-containing protein n=1 Tax=Cladophialophora chaetospira TaxID=386627 RepID=A0AA39CH87_9EURO|nr:hypothetical protein H2200_007177 [Cladophialophora chaetospira]
MAAKLENKAAWQTEAQSKLLKVAPGPDQNDPLADEVIIKVAAVAINPSEWKMQDFSYLPLEYPHVLGSDVAGEIFKVGSGVTRFQAGDRVIGHCLGLLYGGARHGSFQAYTACREVVVAKIPDELPFDHAVVLPLGLSTSITGLFEHLALELPSVDRKSLGKTVLIWGGSSSMGSTAIQLAAASGYEVLTTASERNHAYVKSLGASEVFDYSGPGVTKELIQRLSRTDFAGVYDCIGEEHSTRACAEVLSKFGGGVLPTVLWPPNDLPANVKPVLGELNPSSTTVKSLTISAVYATNPGLVPNHVGVEIWRDFVPAALKTGTLQAKPEPKLVDGGLDGIQDAMNLQKKGVSAQKLVVKL